MRTSIGLRLLDKLPLKKRGISLFRLGVKVSPRNLNIKCSKNTANLHKTFCVYNDINRFVYDVYVLLEFIFDEGVNQNESNFSYRNFDDTYTSNMGNIKINYQILRLLGTNIKKNKIILFKLDNIPPNSYIKFHGDFNKTCNIKLSIPTYSMKQDSEVIKTKRSTAIPFEVPKKIGNIKLKGIGVFIKKK